MVMADHRYVDPLGPARLAVPVVKEKHGDLDKALCASTLLVSGGLEKATSDV